MVEPVAPRQHRELDGLEGSPGTSPKDDLDLVEAVDRLGVGVVIAVAHAAGGGLDAGFRQALGIADADILRAAVAMVHQAAAMSRPSLVKSLLQRIQHEAGMSGPVHPSADDAAGIGVDQEGQIDEARPCEPQPVRRFCLWYIVVSERTLA